MDLSHIQAFLTVAETGSVSLAAESLDMAQSTISRQIQALEVDLGAKLFNRRQRALRLTAAGTLFVVEGKRLLYDAEHARTALRDLDAEGLQLRVGYLPALMPAFLADALMAYQKEWPTVTIGLFEAHPAAQIQMLGRQSLDLACMDVMQETRFYDEQIARAPLLIATPQAKAYPKPSFQSLIEQRDTAILVPPRRDYPAFAKLIRSTCLRSGFEPVLHESNSMVSLLAEVAMNKGVALLPAHWSLLPHPGVTFRSLTSGLPDGPVFSLFPSPTRPQHVKAFLGTMRRFAHAKYNTIFWERNYDRNMSTGARTVRNRRGLSTDRRKSDRRISP